ncbi:MAG: hypothetical protein BHV75_04075 [Bacteroides oleiciplenus]|nr:MAG: hypothetical protein BHV75_04075 [Bacteroides oleiciplenus]
MTIIQGGGGGGDVTNADHANSAYTLDEDTPVQNWFLSALKDDEAQGIINFLKGLKIAGNLINRIVKQGDKDVTYTDEDVMSALRVMTEIENSAEKLKWRIPLSSFSACLPVLFSGRMVLQAA